MLYQMLVMLFITNLSRKIGENMEFIKDFEKEIGKEFNNDLLVKILEFGRAMYLDGYHEGVEAARDWISNDIPNENVKWVLTKLMMNGSFYVIALGYYDHSKSDWFCQQIGWLGDFRNLFTVNSWSAI